MRANESDSQFTQGLDRRLRVYPQFGQPLYDLEHKDGQVWSGVVRPLSVRYMVFADRRLVIVATLPRLLPNSGF